MRIAIFGGAGFMGHALAEALIDEHEVFSFDNLSVIPECDCDSRVTTDTVDVTKPWQVTGALRLSSPEVVYWFPAKQGYDDNLYEFCRVNVGGIYSLFQALEIYGASVKKIVLASSQAVYAPGIDRKEWQLTLPPSVYGQSKLQQEKAFRWFCGKKINHSILRYSIILGPGQSLQSTESGILRNWFRAWKNEKAPEVYGDGTHVRDFVHIDDVTKANVLAMKDSVYGTFNVGGFVHPIIDVCNIFTDRLGGVDPMILNRDVRPGGEYSLTSDYAKLTYCNGWHPFKDIGQQIGDFVDSNMVVKE